MRKIIVLLFIGFFILVLPALASEWVEVDHKIYAKIEKYQGSKVFYWVKFLNDGTIKPIGNKKITHNMIYYVSDCSNNMIWEQNVYSYGVSGEVIDSFTSAYPAYHMVVPQSVGEALQDYVCKNNYTYTN